MLSFLVATCWLSPSRRTCKFWGRRSGPRKFSHGLCRPLSIGWRLPADGRHLVLPGFCTNANSDPISYGTISRTKTKQVGRATCEKSPDHRDSFFLLGFLVRVCDIPARAVLETSLGLSTSVRVFHKQEPFRLDYIWQAHDFLRGSERRGNRCLSPVKVSFIPGLQRGISTDPRSLLRTDRRFYNYG